MWDGSNCPSLVVVVQSLRGVWLLWPHQHATLHCPLLPPGVCFNLCPLCLSMPSNHLSSVAPFSSCPQSFPASGSFPMGLLFASNTSQSIGVSASACPFNEFSGLISFQIDSLISFDLIAVQGTLMSLSSTTVQKHKFFVPNLLYSPTLTSIHDYRKNHSWWGWKKRVKKLA